MHIAWDTILHNQTLRILILSDCPVDPSATYGSTAVSVFSPIIVGSIPLTGTSLPPLVEQCRDLCSNRDDCVGFIVVLEAFVFCLLFPIALTEETRKVDQVDLGATVLNTVLRTTMQLTGHQQYLAG